MVYAPLNRGEGEVVERKVGEASGHVRIGLASMQEVIISDKHNHTQTVSALRLPLSGTQITGCLSLALNLHLSFDFH